MERTFIMLKPDAIQRKLIGEILGRIEKKNFNIVEMKMFQPDLDLVKNHYTQIRSKPFFEPMCQYMSDNKVIAMIVEGDSVVARMRTMVGDTQPGLVVPGTIRGDLANDIEKNLIHASDCISNAEREISIWFPEL